jgi:hypothetical protein
MAASTLLAVALSGAAAAQQTPAPCPPGRFLVDPAKAPLVPDGTTEGPDAVELDAQGQVAISSGCGAATAQVKASKKFTKVKLTFPSCGSLTNVLLSGKIKAPACDVFKGKLKAAKAKPKKFTAARSTCGDGVLDPALEDCEAAQPACAGGLPCEACSCAPPPCGAAERPECAGTCEPGLTCRDVFLVGCACFL